MLLSHPQFSPITAIQHKRERGQIENKRLDRATKGQCMERREKDDVGGENERRGC
jgi:hypothetical protein